MTITQDGNSFSWDGTVTVTNATDITTGVCTLILTPKGGIGTLPFLAQGQPGLPPVLDSVTVNQIPYNQAPAAPVLTTVSSGGAGVASHYTLSFEVNEGQPGNAGTFYIAQAGDFSGANTDHYTLIYKSTTSAWTVAPQLCGDTYQCTTFTTITGSGSPATLGTITVPPQPFNWRPNVKGIAIPTGTANTHVDLVCRMGTTTGQQVGYGYGITGAGSGTIPAYPVVMQQAFGGTISNGYGMVNSGSSATFYFLAIQTNTTTDSFNVPSSSMYFTVKVDPVPGSN